MRLCTHTHTHTHTVVRSISGHKAAIHSLDFHRYGDILASGSMDTNLKVGTTLLGILKITSSHCSYGIFEGKGVSSLIKVTVKSSMLFSSVQMADGWCLPVMTVLQRYKDRQ